MPIYTEDLTYAVYATIYLLPSSTHIGCAEPLEEAGAHLFTKPGHGSKPSEVNTSLSISIKAKDISEGPSRLLYYQTWMQERSLLTNICYNTSLVIRAGKYLTNKISSKFYIIHLRSCLAE